MPYAIKYKTSFTSLTDTLYTFDLLKKDYSGAVTTVQASGNPLRYKCSEDDPKAAIKGSSVDLTLINTGTLPINTFYSVQDDEWQGKLTCNTTSEVLFIGYLVQDDCTEDVNEANHEITLAFNDGLGLLKDVKLSDAVVNQLPIVYQFSTPIIQFNSPNILSFSNTGIPVPAISAGQLIKIEGTTFNGLYHVESILNQNPAGASLYVTETHATAAGQSGTVTIYGGVDDLTLLPLSAIVKACLQATTLSLNTHVYAKIKEVTQIANNSFLEQTYIAIRTFLNNDEYMNCYEVLTRIAERFQLSIFQALGKWHIVRWNEKRYYSTWVGYVYDSNFGYIGQVDYPAAFPVTVAESYLQKSVVRPYNFSKETFNYKVPDQYMKNINLAELGPLIRVYMNGTATVEEYVFKHWERGLNAPVCERFIRIVRDALLNEVQRYVVTRGNSWDTWKAVLSPDVEVSKGDVIKWSFSIRTTKPVPGNATILFAVQVSDGVSKKYADENYSIQWKNATGWNYSIVKGDDLINWHNVSIQTEAVPFDGILNLYLPSSNFNGATALDEVQIRDMQLSIDFRINESTKVIGHTHTDIQKLNIKNKDERTIFMDDSPRNAVAGTLFLATSTRLTRDRSSLWSYSPLGAGGVKLGQKTTFEDLFYHRKERSKVEGTIHGLVHTGKHLTMLNLITHTAFTGLNFIYGRLEMALRNDSADGTLWELYNNTEVDGDLVSDYIFKYLFDTK